VRRKESLSSRKKKGREKGLGGKGNARTRKGVNTKRRWEDKAEEEGLLRGKRDKKILSMGREKRTTPAKELQKRRVTFIRKEVGRIGKQRKGREREKDLSKAQREREEGDPIQKSTKARGGVVKTRGRDKCHLLLRKQSLLGRRGKRGEKSSMKSSERRK